MPHAVDPADDSEQFVVHVRDARTGQIDVFRGNGQIRLHDRDLARLLDRHQPSLTTAISPFAVRHAQ